MKCSVRIKHVGDDTATWRDRLNPQTVVCDRHRWQYEERPDLGPFEWEEIK